MIGRRAAAFALDNVVVLVGVVLVAFIGAGIIDAAIGDGGEISEATQNWVGGSAVGLWFMALPLFERSRWRGTPGKVLLGLQITNRDGSRIGFARSLVRNVARFALGYSFLLVLPLVLQVISFRRSRRLFHDQFSGTVVGERLDHGANARSSRSTQDDQGLRPTTRNSGVSTDGAARP